MEVNSKVELMHELNLIEKSIKNVKSVVSSSTKHATDCYDFSMTTGEIQNLFVIIERLNEDVEQLK